MLSILGGLILIYKSKFYHQCYQYTTTATKQCECHLLHLSCALHQRFNSRCKNLPSSRSLANPGSAPVERTKSDRTASISKVM